MKNCGHNSQIMKIMAIFQNYKIGHNFPNYVNYGNFHILKSCFKKGLETQYKVSLEGNWKHIALSNAREEGVIPTF